MTTPDTPEAVERLAERLEQFVHDPMRTNDAALAHASVSLRAYAQLLWQVERLKAENKRLNALVLVQQPDLPRLRKLEVTLRDYLSNGAEAIQRAHDICRSLLPPHDEDLPSTAEMTGAWNAGEPGAQT